MKKNFLITVIMAMAVLMAACSSDDELISGSQSAQGEAASRSTASSKTVLVYMAGRNDLTDGVASDLNEMKQGSKLLGEKDNLLVFVRRYNDGDIPWLARLKNGVVTDSVSVKDMNITSGDGKFRASDPAVMEGVMHYAFSHYPAAEGSYGLVLWGHGCGWLKMEEVKSSHSRAFGVDYGDGHPSQSGNGRWMNISTMAEVLKGMPRLKFIMADCCNFMCLENLYELRDRCDYIIGSPAEIPYEGAPYDKIVTDLFASGKFYSNIIAKYYESQNGMLPLTAIQTSEMNNIASATRQVMQAVKANIGEGYADLKDLIHYYNTDPSLQFTPEYNIFYDAGDFFLKHAPQDAYKQWKQALDKLILDHRTATKWRTDKIWSYKYADFTVTDAKMHGVSMFFEQEPSRGNYKKYNEDIKEFSWYKALNS